jgi:hypothetical protein
MVSKRKLITVLLSSLVVTAIGCAGGSGAGDGAKEDDFATSDFAEDSVLPYAGDWLDIPKALSGVGQFDRLSGTIHDDAKCSTMVGMAAAIVGGRDRFTKFVDAAARLRDGHKDDLDILDAVRAAVDARKLTPRLLHELTEVVVRAYGVANGAYDGQISKMVRASGYEAIHLSSSKPQALVDSLENHEVVPLATIADNEDHITLLWKDGAGTVRLYDSDDIHGSHVLPRGSAMYNKRVEDPRSTWDLAEKYR